MSDLFSTAAPKTMILHTAQFDDRTPPSLWARVATWFAVAMLLCGSVAEASHLHRLPVRQGAGALHVAVAAAPDGEDGANCPLCLLDGSAVPVHVVCSVPVLYKGHTVLPTYSSRMVPLSVPFALSNRPPPAV